MAKLQQTETETILLRELSKLVYRPQRARGRRTAEMNRLFSLERSLHGSKTRLRKLKEMHRSFTAPNELPEKIYEI